MNLEILLSLCGTLCLLSVSLCNKKKEELTQRFHRVTQSQELFQTVRVTDIHITIIKVLTSHSPYKRIVCCSCCAMDTP